MEFNILSPFEVTLDNKELQDITKENSPNTVATRTTNMHMNTL
jgi:hypothetical protein